jgi:hypothetical protein
MQAAVRNSQPGIDDEHVGARSGAFGPGIIAQPGTGWVPGGQRAADTELGR